MIGEPWQQMLVLVTAIGIGWLLGRFDRHQLLTRLRQPLAKTTTAKPKKFVFDEPHHQDLAAYLAKLDSAPNALSTEIALGTLFRRNGEHEKAIEIHQRLFARSDLSVENHAKVQLELAQDFLATGLYGRAESLLHELHGLGGAAYGRYPETQEASKRLLLDIYRTSGEWQKAIEFGSSFNYRLDAQLALSLVHFCCELCEQEMAQGNWLEARRWLRKSQQYQRTNVRVLGLMARVEAQNQNYRRALRYLQQSHEADPAFIPVTLEETRDYYQRMQDQAGLEAYLAELYQSYPIGEILVLWAEIVSASHGPAAAASLLLKGLSTRVSPSAVDAFLEKTMLSEPKQAEMLAKLRPMFASLLADQALYRCEHCGFEGRHLHWLCPSCHHWETVKPISGLEF